MTSSQHHQHLLTQSYYDELLEDNAELYDLDDVENCPEQQTQCVRETVEELTSGIGSSSGANGGTGIAAANGDGGGGANGSVSGGKGRQTLDHLVLHHPSSSRGARLRARQSALESDLTALDELIQTDGSVQKLDTDEEMEEVTDRLRTVQDACCGIVRGQGQDEDGAAAEAEAAVDGRQAYRSLVAFQTTSSIYTLMSLLGVVSLSSASSSSSGGDGDTGSRQGTGCSEREEAVLRQTCQTLTSILGPPNAALVRSVQSPNVDTASGDDDDESEGKKEVDEAIAAVLSPPPVLLRLIKSTKSEIRDAFVAFERLVGLMELYTAFLLDNDSTDGGSGGTDGSGALEVLDVLTDLARLAEAACGGCERNKVSFVRAGKKKNSMTSTGNSGRDGSGGIAAVVGVLTALIDQSKTNQANSEAEDEVKPAMAAYCKLLAVLCRFDDFRSPSATSSGTGGGGALPTPDMTVSSAHDHVLEFHRQGVVSVLHEVTTLALGDDANGEEEGSDTDLASAALAATRTLAVNDEIVQALVAVGVLRSARLALTAGVVEANDDDGESTKDKTKAKQRRALTSASLGLIRNLCGNDEIKTNLCLGTADGNLETTTVLPSIVQAMRLYRTDAAVQEHGCATLAAMALRKPANAQRIVEEGGPMEVLTAMRRHPSVVPVQRQGALAVRNISSRLIKIAEAEQSDGTASGGSVGNDSTSPKSSAADTTTAVEVRETFLDLGAESVLRDIAGKHQGSVDEAYAALRDLGCKVSMVRYDTNADGKAKSGSGTRGVTMFGEAKTKFNPVFEESNELGAAVDRL